MSTAPATDQPANGNQTANTADPAANTPAKQPAATGDDNKVTEQPKAEGDKPEAKPEGDKKPEDGDKDKPTGAPEKYEFAGPEGMELDQELLGEFEGTARELNLTQDQANKLFGLGTKLAEKLLAGHADSVNSLLAASADEWAKTSKADKEFGGDALDANLAVAKKTLDTFGSPELRQLLNDTGLGNHPEIVRLAYRVGKAISEDGVIRGSAASTGDKPFYSNSQMNR
jgi:hypothetical protein